MSALTDPMRRQILGAAMITATGFGAGALAGPAFGGAPPSRFRDGAPRLRTVQANGLEIAYSDAGPANGSPVILLHGWPYDIAAFDDATSILVSAGCRVLSPYLRGFGGTRFMSTDTMRNGQPAAVASDTLAMMDALGIREAVIGGFDWGARSADIIAALWPERCRGLVAVSGYLIGSQAAGARPLPPAAELQWWYQFYFATQRGRAGYEANRAEFNKLIWRMASPQWRFDDATFARSSAAFENPDHVAIVIHNYRWRMGLVEGEARYNALEARLATGPSIAVPTITMEGDANGAPHSEPAAYRAKFTGPYAHRLISGGIGHNLPQEAPAAFAEAILDASRLSPSSRS